MIGPAGDPGEGPAEHFDVRVCTPQWLGHQVTAHGPLIDRHHLLVEAMDLDAATTFLAQRVDAITGEELGRRRRGAGPPGLLGVRGLPLVLTT